jgi:hypothetical protein
MPENVDELSKLESKIIQITTKAGLSASGYDQIFVIYPKFAIYETNVVEGGMQNITVVTADLSLFIKQVSNNLLFSSVSKSLRGSGRTKKKPKEEKRIKRIIFLFFSSRNNYICELFT